MRVSASEKLERIRLVEGSSLSVRHTLAEIQLPRATFYACLLYTSDAADE